MALGAHRLAEQATGQGQGVSPPPALGTGDKVAVSGGLVSQCPMHKPSRADLSFFPLLSSLKHHGVHSQATPKVITFHSIISSLRHISFRHLTHAQHCTCVTHYAFRSNDHYNTFSPYSSSPFLDTSFGGSTLFPRWQLGSQHCTSPEINVTAGKSMVLPPIPHPSISGDLV